MGRHPDANQRAACCDHVGDRSGAGQQQGQRTGPEGGHELARLIWKGTNKPSQHRLFGDVHNDRVPGRTLLGGEDALYRGGVQGVCAQAVNRFGGKGNQASGAQEARRPPDRFLCFGGFKMSWVDGQTQSLHLSIVALSRRSMPGRGKARLALQRNRRTAQLFQFHLTILRGYS